MQSKYVLRERLDRKLLMESGKAQWILSGWVLDLSPPLLCNWIGSYLLCFNGVSCVDLVIYFPVVCKCWTLEWYLFITGSQTQFYLFSVQCGGKRKIFFFPLLAALENKNNAGVPIEIRVNFRRCRPTCLPLKAKRLLISITNVASIYICSCIHLCTFAHSAASFHRGFDRILLLWLFNDLLTLARVGSFLQS